MFLNILSVIRTHKTRLNVIGLSGVTALCDKKVLLKTKEKFHLLTNRNSLKTLNVHNGTLIKSISVPI